MIIKKFSDLNESSKKEDIKEDIIEMLEKQPKVKMSGEHFPDEKDAYSFAGIKNYLKDKYSNIKIDNAIADLMNDKSSPLNIINVKNYWDEERIYPYFYHEDYLSKEEATDVKNKYEEWSKENDAETIEKRKEKRKKAAEITKKTGRKEATQKQLDALKKAREARKQKKEKQNESKKYNNELESGKDPAKNKNIEIKKGNLPEADRVKGISTFLDDIDKKVLSTIKEKGVAMSTYKISDNVGINVKDVHNVLEKLESEEKIQRKYIGKDSYWKSL